MDMVHLAKSLNLQLHRTRRVYRSGFFRVYPCPVPFQPMIAITKYSKALQRGSTPHPNGSPSLFRLNQ
uniref:Uncharacterized protein n=1 Tax=Picea glauca TaxID=3330 RepID=A0A124GNQ0_PICGL|nr:hypothetical protein ABT39_MTgene2730 [Picea glauca]